MFQAVARCNNKNSFVLGEISKEEAELAQGGNVEVSRQGLYLIAVDNDDPKAPGVVLAKFISEEAAEFLARFFRAQGLLEA